MADPVKPTHAAPAPTAAPVSREEANRQAEQANKARSDAREAANKKLDEDDKARHDANVEAGKRQAESKPTPTQRENDLAKLGLLDPDEKEDDGSGPEVMPGALRRDVSAEDAAKYKTRDVTKK